MFLLTLGVLIWSAAHLFGRLAPDLRARMGIKSKGALWAVGLVATVLMVVGYRSADGTFYWGRSPMLVGINNLLMLVSVYLFAAAGMKTAIARRLRHPMLIGVILWAVAHLLVNGDSPSFLLFGGMILWALLSILLINRAGPWVKPAAKPAKFEAMALAGTLLVYGAIAGLHYALGYPAFG